MIYRLTEYQVTNEALPQNFDVVGLKSYLDTVWQSRSIFYDEQASSEEKSKNQPFLSFDYAGPKCGPRLRASKYVGFIQYDGITIELVPKLFEADQSSIAFRHLLWWLSYCRNIKFPFTELLTGSETIEDFPEALIGYFARFTYNLISTQPYHRYEEHTETMAFLRGRLNTSAYVQQSLSQGLFHQLVCDHEPFVYDNRLNQIIKFVARKLSGLCRFTDTYRLLERILFQLDEVSDVPVTVQDCDKIQFHRFYQDYDLCLQMCRFFLEDDYLSPKTDQHRHLCFLLPMDYVFEDFIAGITERYFTNRFKIQAQKAGCYLTDQKAFLIKNDLLLTDHHTGQKLVIDTKYKVRSVKPDDNKKGISQADLYQMVSYALRRETDQVLLLYPKAFGQTLSNDACFTVSSSLLSKNPLHIRSKDIDITGMSHQVMVNNVIGQLEQSFNYVA